MKSNFSNSNEFCTLFDFQSDEDMFAGMPPMAGLPNMPDPSEMSGGSKFDGGGATKEVARYLLIAKKSHFSNMRAKRATFAFHQKGRKSQFCEFLKTGICGQIVLPGRICRMLELKKNQMRHFRSFFNNVRTLN